MLDVRRFQVETSWQNLLAALAVSKVRVDWLAREALTRVVPCQPACLVIVTISCDSLGFDKPITTAQLLECAMAQGLQLCPIEVALRLCLQQDILPKNCEEAIVVSEPIQIDGTRVLFRVRPGRLAAEPVGSNRIWSPRRVFVFAATGEGEAFM